ncbi:MAG: UDP-N-acetylglucosamine 1-carboxyvinyltransferase, partial [Clostridia bacterium]|nr:UDP-N-acetylglucosamine 1-carboxyvinyltransferase [Clostridia bacterium]
SPVIDIFEQAGNEVEIKNGSVTLKAPERLNCVKTVRTMPYPGFPTDIQPPVAAMLCRAEGVSVIIETIFENRFKYIGGLSRFGARVRAEGRLAVIDGTDRLYPAKVETPDLRGGAALVLAALSAEGESVVSGVRHIDRGYEDLERTLCSLSAEIKRTD